MKKILHISAGGKNIRIKDDIGSLNIPSKHFLPIPDSNISIIEKIIIDSHDFFEKIIIHSNPDNHEAFICFKAKYKKVDVTITKFIGPLGPIYEQLSTQKSRSYLIAGDCYSSIDWQDFEHLHNKNQNPITILGGKSCKVDDGACFIVNKNKITGWKRKNTTNDNDIINIGAYIIDPTEHILKSIEKLDDEKEDSFFHHFINTNSIAIYIPNGLSFNFNKMSTYKYFINYIKRSYA